VKGFFFLKKGLLNPERCQVTGNFNYPQINFLKILDVPSSKNLCNAVSSARAFDLFFEGR